MPKSIMIIGAGPGIGRATAERFGREGWAVILAGRNVATLDSMVGDLVAHGIDAHAVPADATDPASLRTALQAAAGFTGTLDVVHYNAAYVRAQDLFSMTDAEIASDLAVNVAGGLYAIRAAVAQFGPTGGTILVTGGGLAIEPHHGYASLGLGKAALRNVVQALAAPLAERTIRIAMATVATLVSPSSLEADGVAQTLWILATDASQPWEAIYPQR
jgi:NAD(P)-dependent dehydrogenase (short-subunit alcohol dehydrogenase family)